MRNPTKVSGSLDLKTCVLERPGVFPETRNVGLITLLRKTLPQPATEEGKVFVHIDHDRLATRSQQGKDVLREFLLSFKAVRISRGVDTDDQIECSSQVFPRRPQLPAKV